MVASIFSRALRTMIGGRVGIGLANIALTATDNYPVDDHSPSIEE
jgi:hypothetical protein